MHLEINNDLELDVNNASISRRKSKKSSSLPIKRNKKVSFKLKTPKRMSSANPRMLAKKKRPSKSTSAKRVSAFKSKPLMPSILINGKKVPLKAMKRSSALKMKEVVSDSRRGTSNSRRKASTSRQEASSSRRKSSVSRRKASVSRRKSSVSRRKSSVLRRKASASRRKASASRRKVSDSRKGASSSRKASDARRKASASRRKASASRRKASAARRKASLARLRDARGRFTKKGTEVAEKSPTIFMPIQQTSDSKTAEAIVVSNEKEENKAGVTDVKIVEK